MKADLDLEIPQVGGQKPRKGVIGLSKVKAEERKSVSSELKEWKS